MTQYPQILKQLDSDIKWRKKKDLIQKFIEENSPHIKDEEAISKEFDIFWDKEKQQALANSSSSEGLDQEQFKNIISDYLYTDKLPRRADIISLKNKKTKLTERKTVFQNIKTIIIDFVERFE